MSKQVTVGSTVGEAFNFAFGNISAVVRIGWFPLSITMGLLALIAWVFFQPIIAVYMQFLANLAATTDPDAMLEVMEQYNEDMLTAVELIGYQMVSLGYLLFVVVAIVGAAIPMTAYTRMMVNGDKYRGLIYMQLGGREISVGITYLVVTILVVLIYFAFALVAGIAAGIIGAIAAAAMGEAGAVILALLIFGVIIVGMIFMLWLFARLLVAVPASAMEGGSPIGKAWSMTKGHGATLTLALILGYIVLTIAWIAFFVAVAYLIGFLSGLVGGAETQLGTYLTIGIGALAYLIMMCVGNAFFIGLFAGPYKRLVAGTEPIEPTLS